jgi:hypothetical protein
VVWSGEREINATHKPCSQVLYHLALYKAYNFNNAILFTDSKAIMQATGVTNYPETIKFE